MGQHQLHELERRSLLYSVEHPDPLLSEIPKELLLFWNFNFKFPPENSFLHAIFAKAFKGHQFKLQEKGLMLATESFQPLFDEFFMRIRFAVLDMQAGLPVPNEKLFQFPG